jgi:Uma2 family endonuclease
MNLIPSSPSPTWTVSRLRRHFGMIPAGRILMDPAPGTATEQDVLRINQSGDHLYELVDGVLLGKPMGSIESILAGILMQHINNFLDVHELGVALGPDGMLRLVPGLVRIPDISFITWDRLPKGPVPKVPALAPDLAVEVISEGNTKKEIDRKLCEYFENGTRLAWVVYPKSRTVVVYTSLESTRRLRSPQTLTGGRVLPGFRLPLSRLFDARRRPGHK